MTKIFKCAMFTFICMAVFIQAKTVAKDSKEKIEDVNALDDTLDNKKQDSKIEEVTDDNKKQDSKIEEVTDDNKKQDSKIEEINDDNKKQDSKIEEINDDNKKQDNKVEEVTESTKEDIKNDEKVIEGEAKDVTDKDDPPKEFKTDVCLDRRGDCAAVVKYCPALRGLCDKTCGYCKGILGHKDTFVFGLENVNLRKGSLIARVPYIGKEYSVTFDLLPKVFGSGYRSVIHFTSHGGNTGARGGRIPSVWFHGASTNSETNRLHICSDYNGATRCYDTNNFVSRGKWVQVNIAQNNVFGGYYYSIRIDGHVIYTLRNSHPNVYRLVYVYGGSPWYNVNEGTIRNLVIKTRE